MTNTTTALLPAFESQGLSLSANGRVVTVTLYCEDTDDWHEVECELNGGEVVGIGPQTLAMSWVESNERECQHIYDLIIDNAAPYRAAWRRTGMVM